MIPLFAETNMYIGALLAVAALATIIFAFVIFNFFTIWVRALFNKAHVGFFELIGLKLRGVPVGMIVDERITSTKAGMELTVDELSTHHVAGGNVLMVIAALIGAQKAGIPLTFDRACAIDLSTKGTGKTVLEAVQTSVNPKVIDCPNNHANGRTTIDAVAKDGIGLKVRARVTVRTNLSRFVGGATEETIVARIGEGIVATIGSSNSYKDVLEQPDRISKTVLAKGLDANTAFEILSVDIADIDVGENVAAKLQAEQAESNKLVSQAEAEGRRAAAVATEQEMKARVQEMRAKLVEAEAQIPQAIAEAFRSGHLGIMDYQRIKNLQADTQMRSAIGGAGATSTENP